MKRTNRRFFCFGVSGMLAVGALQSLPAKESELSGNFEALIPANFTIDDDLTPYLPNVKQALKRRDEASTAALIAASKSLFNAGAHEQFLCGNSFLSVTNTSVEPLRHPRVLFDAVLDELLSREGKPVFVWMQQLLLSENLDKSDKHTI